MFVEDLNQKHSTQDNKIEGEPYLNSLKQQMDYYGDPS